MKLLERQYGYEVVNEYGMLIAWFNSHDLQTSDGLIRVTKEDAKRHATIFMEALCTTQSTTSK